MEIEHATTSTTVELLKSFLDMPLVSTAVGAIIGSSITLFGMWLQSKHASKENQKRWEREESSKQTERLFNKKSKIYEDFFELCNESLVKSDKSFLSAFFDHISMLMLYAPDDIQKKAREIIALQHDYFNTGDPAEYENINEQLYVLRDELKTLIRADLEVSKSANMKK